MSHAFIRSLLINNIITSSARIKSNRLVITYPIVQYLFVEYALSEFRTAREIRNSERVVIARLWPGAQRTNKYDLEREAKRLISNHRHYTTVVR